MLESIENVTHDIQHLTKPVKTPRQASCLNIVLLTNISCLLKIFSSRHDGPICGRRHLECYGPWKEAKPWRVCPNRECLAQSDLRSSLFSLILCYVSLAYCSLHNSITCTKSNPTYQEQVVPFVISYSVGWGATLENLTQSRSNRNWLHRREREEAWKSYVYISRWAGSPPIYPMTYPWFSCFTFIRIWYKM